MSATKPTMEFDEEEKCPICLDLLHKPAVTIECKHHFCHSCLLSWLADIYTSRNDHNINYHAGALPHPLTSSFRVLRQAHASGIIFSCPMCRTETEAWPDFRVQSFLDPGPPAQLSDAYPVLYRERTDMYDQATDVDQRIVVQLGNKCADCECPPFIRPISVRPFWQCLQ